MYTVLCPVKQHNQITNTVRFLYFDHLYSAGTGLSAAAPARHLARGEGSDREQLHQHTRHGEHIVAEHGVGQHTEIGWQGARGAPARIGQPVSTINLWYVECGLRTVVW